jgi:hypothetical protein
MHRYRERLEAGDPRGALAAMVKGAGGIRAAVKRMPLWYIKLILRLAIRGEHWRQIEVLLDAALGHGRNRLPANQSNGRPVVPGRRPTRADLPIAARWLAATPVAE